MATLPKLEDPTLAAMARAMEAESLNERPRAYLGMSSIGDECSRKLWYQWRWVARAKFKAKTLAAFADGHYSEWVMSERLKKVPGVELITTDAEGGQIGYVDLEGHLRGHMDGAITGILQSPKTPHVWEHKCSGEKKFKELQKCVEKHGEKQALKAWSEIYYAQAVLYMYYGKYKRHYLTCALAGTRDWISIRTEENSDFAEELIRKAESIINADSAPEKLSNDPAFYKCRWCDFNDVCHGEERPQKNCRTCLKSCPTENGKWECREYGAVVPFDFQQQGCDLWASLI